MPFARSEDRRIAYQVSGPESAPPIVLLHALGADMRMWEPQREALEADHRVVRLDLRGHGASDAPPGPYTVELLAEDVLAVCEDIGLPRFHLCGLSLGGLVALWLASRHPGCLRSAVFSNTAARIGTPELWEERIAAIRRAGMEGIREAALSRFFSESFATAHPEVVRAAEETLLTTSSEGYIGCCEALRTADLRSEVSSISVPSLILAGRRDVSTPPEEVHRLHDQIPDGELVVLDAGHLSNLEQPEAFSRTILSFLGDQAV